MTDEQKSTAVLMESATAAIVDKDLPTARRLLRQVTSQDSENYRAWMLLSGITTEQPSAALHYARRAHDLAPNDASVQAALEWAEQKYNEANYDASIKETFILAGDTTSPLTESDTHSDIEPTSVSQADPVTAGLGRLFLLGILLLGLLFIACGLYYRFFRGIATTNAQTIAEVAPILPPTATDEPLLITLPTSTFTPTPPPTDTPTPTPLPTETPLPPTATPLPPTPLPSPTPDDTRWIDVNLTTQTLTAYELGVPVFTTAISSGLAETPTVIGRFRIYYKLPIQHMTGFHLGFDYDTPDVPNVMYFTGDFAIHGAYWHDDFGQPASHGCVNVSVSDSQWLYNFADIGTFVEVHH